MCECGLRERRELVSGSFDGAARRTGMNHVTSCPDRALLSGSIDEVTCSLCLRGSAAELALALAPDKRPLACSRDLYGF